MMTRSFWFAAALTTIGCSMPVDSDATPTQDEPVGAAQQAAGIEPPKGLNGKRGFCMWDLLTRFAYKEYANEALDAGGGWLPSGISILEECRDEVIANMVECALGEDQTLRDPENPEMTYRGHWGLAPGWYSSPLSSTSDRRWVTGCMVQRLNAYEVTVPILLEGAATPINSNAVFQAEFPFRESLAYGDLFTPPAISHGVVDVCYNEDLSRACHTSISPHDWLEDRICDTSPTCGMKVVGPCAVVCRYEGLRYPICLNDAGEFDDHTVEVRLELGSTCE